MMRVRIGYEDHRFSKVLRYPGNAGHLVTVAPTGGGKGRDILVPALLDDSLKDTSCLVVDPKGQLASITAPQAARMGKQVIILNPFNIWSECIGPGAKRFRGLEDRCKLTAGYNPMATLDPVSDDFVPDAEGLAQAIIYSEQGSREEHWTESARDLVCGLILYAVARGPASDRNIAWVRSTVCNRKRLFEIAAKFYDLNDALSEADDFIRQKLGRFGEPDASDNKEIGSIISTAVTQTSFIGNAAITKSLADSSFLFRQLRQTPTILYLILPGRRLKTCARWFRLIVGAALNELMEEQTERGCAVLFLLDEFAQLRRLAAIEDAFGIARDYGLLLWPILQDLNQLKRDYPDSWETMLANAGVVQFFRPQDNTTAEYISKRTADVVVDRGIKKRFSEDAMTPGRLNVSYEPDWKEKKYLEPWEVREIGTDEFLLFAAGKNGVLRGGKQAYWDIPEFDGLYAPDPYHP